MHKISSLIIFLFVAACSGQSDQDSPAGDTVLLTVIGTNDVHGELLPARNSGGLTTLSGYVEAVRIARAEDGGAVLLIDAGDMWQGTLESNLVEGESIVQAYNAMGFTAAAIGNHEFDFGPIGKNAVPTNNDEDPRGALKQRIDEAEFPVLSANIVNIGTGDVIDWDGVTPSVMVEAAGIKVGIIGLITTETLNITVTANTVGIKIAPLADAIIREATMLRDDGADIVIVAAHAGGRCQEFNDPHDLSSCSTNDEIFKVANALPPGLIDQIVAGHQHRPIAHFVNGIAVTSAFSNTYAFDRVDYTIDPTAGDVLELKIYPPQMNCPAYNRKTGDCEWTETDPTIVELPVYEGKTVTATAQLQAIAAEAIARTEAVKSEPIGVTLENRFYLDGTAESPLARLYTDAILEEVDADISIHNVSGGIRAELDAGPVTFGDIYEVSPFDNQVVILDMSGADLRRIMLAEAVKSGRRAGFSGMRVFVNCVGSEVSVRMVLDDGREVSDSERILVSTNDFLATLNDGMLSPGMPDGGYRYDPDSRMSRDLIVEWFKKRGGSLSHREYVSNEANRRWNFSESFVTQCQNGV
jgi:5'-nucleotidase